MSDPLFVALFCLVIAVLLYALLYPILRPLGPISTKDTVTNPIPTAPYRAQIGDKVLATCDNYFVAPNGQLYRAVFGTMHAVSTAEDTLGIKPNGKSTNWYLQIGNVTIAGCQVHYLVKTDKCNLDDCVPMSNIHEGLARYSQMPSQVYNADKEPT